jgi:tryptophan synthase alpha subunit
MEVWERHSIPNLQFLRQGATVKNVMTLLKKTRGADTEPSFLLYWNQTGSVLQRQIFQTLQLCGEVHGLCTTDCSDIYTKQ